MSPKARKAKKTPPSGARPARSTDRKSTGGSSRKKSGSPERKARAASGSGKKKTATGKTRPAGRSGPEKKKKTGAGAGARPVARLKRKKVAKRGAKRRARKRSRFSPKELRHYHELLLHKQRELTDAYHLSKGDSRSDLDDGTEDYIDYAVHSYAREFLLSLTELDRKQLYLVDQALERLNRGEYGNCEQCQKEIHAKRLEVAPWAKYCVPCQELEERGLLPQPEDEEEEPGDDLDLDEDATDDEAGDEIEEPEVEAEPLVDADDLDEDDR